MYKKEEKEKEQNKYGCTGLGYSEVLLIKHSIYIATLKESVWDCF